MAARHAGLGKRHIAAVTVGNTIEFYDFLAYALFAIQIGRALFPPSDGYGNLLISLTAFGAGFIARPIGAWIIGRWSDRVGRRPAMVASLVLMGVSVTGLALTPSYADIGIAASIMAFLFRLAGGFALGGELGCNTAYLSEAASAGRRGLVVSWQAASQLIGLSMAATVALLLELWLTPDAFAAWGWRIALLAGAIAIPFGLWLRRSLPEPPHTEFATAPTAGTVRQMTLASRRTLAAAFLAIAGGTVCNYILTYTATYAQDTLRLPAGDGFAAALAGFLIGIPASLLGGWMSDIWGRRPVMIGFTVFLLFAIWPCYALVVETPSVETLIVCNVVLSIGLNGASGPIYAAIAEGLPRVIRGTAFGLVYSSAIALFGGSAQPIAAMLLHETGSPYAVAWQAMAAAVVALTGCLLFRETAPGRFVAPRAAVSPPSIASAG